MHGLETGDFVTFRELKGLAELNDCEPIEIEVISKCVLKYNKVSLRFVCLL